MRNISNACYFLFFHRSGDEGSDTLQDHVCLAEKEDRLIQGIFESAHVLEL